MDALSSYKALIELLTTFDGSIRYRAFPDEVACDTLLIPTIENRKIVTIPSSAHVDAFEWARTCVQQLERKNTYILIPGRAFDIYGVRHGRGGGWYDRFLSKIPKQWLRIGVAQKAQLSYSPIERKEWDELVDWVIVCDETGACEAYKTHARIWPDQMEEHASVEYSR